MLTLKLKAVTVSIQNPSRLPMEHLAGGTISCLPKVPYIVEYSYDSRGFHSFPSRAGWFTTEDGRWERHDKDKGRIRLGPLGSVAAFLQSWLFFGLLVEVLGPDAQVNPIDFRKQDGHGYWRITTAKLPTYIREWRDRELKQSSDRIGRMIRAQLALDEAHSLVSKYCSVSNANERPLWDIDEMLALSFMILGETLSNAKAVILEAAGLKMHGWYINPSRGWGDSTAVLQGFKSDKWCPRSIHILQGLLDHNVSGMLYALHLSHPKALGLDHSTCSVEECQARKPHAVRRVCRQTEQPCQCKDVGPNMSELIRIIEDGKIPLLQYRSDGPRIDVIEYKDGVRYMILSHVWADGFGNSRENTLPACRIESFIEVFDRLTRAEQALHAGSAPGRVETTIPFWIDTLAVPTGGIYESQRRKAIRNMHQTYRLATYTVILDAGLMSQDSGGTYAETAMKITTSHWMTRLWTLQEAFLSKRLLFNFANALIDMDDLERMHKDRLISAVPLAAGSYYRALLGLEREKRKYEPSLSISPDLLASLWKAVQWRNTTHLQHETLALATLLQLNTDPFDDLEISTATQSTAAEVDLDKKMQILLSLIASTSDHAIPAGLIFLPGQRLSAEGYRWAPKTWMTGQIADYPDPFQPPTPGAQLTDRGLLVRYPGYRLHTINLSGEEINKSDPFVFPSDNSLNDWVIVSGADKPKHIQPIYNGHCFAIITMNQKIGSIRQIALLVAIQEIRVETIHVQLVKRVWIHTETKLSRIDKLRRDFKDGTLQAPCGESLKPDQQWCLDGPEEIYHPTEDENNSDTSRMLPFLRFFYRNKQFTTSRKSKT